MALGRQDMMTVGPLLVKALNQLPSPLGEFRETFEEHAVAPRGARSFR